MDRSEWRNTTKQTFIMNVNVVNNIGRISDAQKIHYVEVVHSTKVHMSDLMGTCKWTRARKIHSKFSLSHRITPRSSSRWVGTNNGKRIVIEVIIIIIILRFFMTIMIFIVFLFSWILLLKPFFLLFSLKRLFFLPLAKKASCVFCSIV